MNLLLRPLLAVLVLSPVVAQGADHSGAVARPMIWATAADRPAIVAKIETQPWARSVFAAMQARVAEAVAAHTRDPDVFLRDLPLVPHPTDPARHPTFSLIEGNMASTAENRRGHSLQRFLRLGTDCAVLFYLTADERYARCAADILAAATGGLALMPRKETESGGIVYPGDVLYEARALGAQLPLLYDFLHGWLRAGGRVHDLVTRRPVPFDFARAQRVFRAYARLVIEHGQIDSNHPVLEMPCLALNALALDDPAERADLLAHLTTRDTRHQDSLQKVMRVFTDAGGVWPESFQYSVGVSARVTYLAALLRRQSPPAIPLEGFSAFPLSLVRLVDFRFPNGENVRFGDGPRRSGQPYESLEIAYALALREGDTALQRTLGGLILQGIAEGKHDRARPLGYGGGSESYHGPVQLLWFAPEISAPPAAATAPRTTDVLPFAGLALQRNLSPNHDPAHALMAVVSGASFVHSHASGMALELYGAGHVLGANAGKGTYTTDEHENHRRLFAAHNSVVVNGASRSAGGWVSLGIDTVRPVALEPAPGAAPVSANHSFTLTRFTDRLPGDATADQERLVGIVRTSATTGYYVDVFRSRATTADQFHDYLYRNLGDRLELTAAGGPLALADTPGRFRPAAGTSWSRNRSYLFPGWHVFDAVRSSAPLAGDVAAEFTARKLAPADTTMRLWIPGGAGRDYATALAPAIKEAPPPYDKSPAPVLVVRQRGEAWTRPFAVIYEPSSTASASAIRSVTALRDGGVFAGFRIVSDFAGRRLTQLVLIPPDPEREFAEVTHGVVVRGRYAVVTLGADGALTHLYLGEGRTLSAGGTRLASTSAQPLAAAATFENGRLQVVATGPITGQPPPGVTLSPIRLIP